MFLPIKLLELELRRQLCFKDYLHYNNSIDKVDRCSQRINFLEKCRDADIIPKFLQFRVPNNGCFDSDSIKNFQKRLLHKEIKKAKTEIVEHMCNLDIKRSTLRTNFPGNVFHQ